MRDETTGLILAGGRSRRFGSDKAGFEFAGQPMIVRVYERIALLCPQVLVSVAEGEARYPLPSTVRYVEDRHPEAGPLAGLHAGFMEAHSTWMLVVACDMPMITVEALNQLLAARSDTVDAVVATSGDGRTHPLCACYQQRVAPVIAELLGGKHRSMHSLLDRIRVYPETLPEDVLRNVNARTDLPSNPSGSARY